MVLAGVKKRRIRSRPESGAAVIARLAGDGLPIRIRGQHKPGTHYTSEQRHAALVTLAMNGGDVSLTAEQTGIDHSVLCKWRQLAERSDAIAENTLRMSESRRIENLEARSEDWGQRWGAVEAEALARIRQVLPLTTNVRDLAILAGISADKRQDHYFGRKGQNVPGAMTGGQIDARQVNIHLNGVNPSPGDASAKLSQAATVLAEVARRIGGGGEPVEPFTTAPHGAGEATEATSLPDSPVPMPEDAADSPPMADPCHSA